MSRSVPVTQGVLVVGWYLVCHFIVFILESFAVTPSVVELLNASCIEQIKNVRQRPTFLLYIHTIVINC